MSRSKFNLNSLILVIIVLSVITFAVILSANKLSRWVHYRDDQQIEGTDLIIRYSGAEKSGIYRGDKLMIEGKFGQEWDSVVVDGVLYGNEYSVTTFDMMKCNFVAVDLETFEKTLIAENASIRGICESGEIVYLTGFLPPTWYSDTNKLRTLCCMGDCAFTAEYEGAGINYYDVSKGETVYSLVDTEALASDRMTSYLERSLEEVKNEKG